jgi:hypothetical protein
MVLRMDDFDPRISLDLLKPLHEEFLKRNIPMVIAVNNAMGHRMKFDEDVLKYVNEDTPAESWDIQLHTFNHDRLWAMPYPEVYMNIYTNLNLTKRDFPRSNPTILYPPWNEECAPMIQACNELGIKVVSSRLTIRELLWTGREDKDCFFWHWWGADDREILPQALDRLIELNTQRGF